MRGVISWKVAMNLRVVVLILLLSVSWNSTLSVSSELPCHFLDSVNITNGVLHPNKSITIDGIIFPQGQYAKIDYVFVNGTDQLNVEPYIRGCICNQKPCIRLCCPYGSIVKSKDGRERCQPHEAARNLEGEIYDQNMATKPVKLNQHFTFVDQIPCKHFYFADDEDYKLTKKGEVLLSKTAPLNHHEYCVKVKLNEKTNQIDLSLTLCFPSVNAKGDSIAENIRFAIFPIGMILSVMFIIATLFIYICIPKLRNLHGKCLMCYLASLAVGYTLLSFVQLHGSMSVHGSICTSIGYLIYFTVLSAFLWLSVINFDLWLNSRLIFSTAENNRYYMNPSTSGFKKLSEQKQFLLYMLYGCGISCLLTTATYIIDQSESIPEELQPEIGVYNCFMQHNWISQFLFLYMPVSVIFTINIVLFILTAMRLRQVHRDDTKSEEDNFRLQKTLNNKKDTYTLYLRLFVITGISWSLEVISFLIAPGSLLFLVPDICNTLHGVIIFLLFIMKHRVRHLIKARWNHFCGKTNASADSCSSESDNYVHLNTTPPQ